jgi:hypothetical protein
VTAPEGRLYAPLGLGVAALLLALGLALGVLTVASVTGPFRLLGPRPVERASAGLWRPAAADPDALRPALRSWRAALAGRADLRDGTSPERLREAGADVLVVVDGHVLSDGELAALRAFARQGGGVIASGALGVAAADGSWLGWERMARLLEVEAVVPVAGGAAGLSPVRRGPLAAGLPPERRIELTPEPGAPAIDDPAAEIAWAPHETGARGASKRLELGAGRLVWLAAGPERAAGWRAERGFESLAAAAFAWAAREPFAEVLAWPERAPFAALVESGAAPGEPARGAAEARTALRAALERAARQGGLAALGPLAAGQPPELLAGLAPELSRRGAWVADAGELDAWLRRRDALRVRLARQGPRRHLLEVTNGGREPVTGAVLRVHLNAPVDYAEVQRTLLQQEAPAFRFERAEQRVDIELPALGAGHSLAYTLDLEGGGGAG